MYEKIPTTRSTTRTALMLLALIPLALVLGYLVAA